MRLASRATVVGLAAAGLAALPGPAAGAGGSGSQSSVSSSSTVTLYDSVNGPTPVVEVEVPARVSGDLVVQFHGAAAARCSTIGVCDYSGAVSWIPVHEAFVTVVESREHGRTSYQASLELLDPSSFPGAFGGSTDAEVAFTPPGADQPQSTCVDAADTGTGFDWPTSSGRVSVNLTANPSVIETRCAGPLIDDLKGALPALSVPVGAVMRGDRSLNLGRTRSFTAGGFTGTVSSTLTLALGRPRRNVLHLTSSSTGGNAFRELAASYRVRITGTVGEQIRGDSAPALCAPLGSCGINGRLTFDPSSATQRMVLFVIGSSKLPDRDYLAALGIGDGNAKRLEGIGIASWAKGGAVTETTQQDGVRCHDAGSSGPIQLLITGADRRLSIEYGYGLGEQVVGLRTRCPGPFASAGALASANLPVTALRRRTVTIVLTHPNAFSDDGYVGAQSPDLTLTLTRERVSTSGEGLSQASASATVSVGAARSHRRAR